ncbi:MAG: redoxin domain-containing protein [candidate division Zixibacteria bacterium]|nr:redoxin domain-containing protein [candidate division Zixibacteria bacterium]
MYGQHRSHARRSAVLSAQTRELQTGAPGIRIGQPLPAVLVWAVEQDHAYEIRQLLPEGGVVLMVSTGCDVCVTAAEQMQAAIANSRGSEVRAILITKQATGARQLRETLRAQGVTLDVFCDVQESFLRAHHVTANPAFIILDSSGVVRDFGAGVPDGPRLAGESSLDQ